MGIHWLSAARGLYVDLIMQCGSVTMSVMALFIAVSRCARGQLEIIHVSTAATRPSSGHTIIKILTRRSRTAFHTALMLIIMKLNVFRAINVQT